MHEMEPFLEHDPPYAYLPIYFGVKCGDVVEM